MTRKILIAVAMGGVWAAFGCGSSGSSGTPGQGQGPGPALVSTFGTPGTVPQDPNAPPPDPNAPPADPNAPPPDPNAPPVGGPSSGRTCSSLCVGIDSSCADGCTQLCSELGQVVPVCTAVFSAVRDCISANLLVCANGKVRVAGDKCNEEGQALLSCATPPHPGSGGQNNGSGGQNNGSGGQNNGGGQCSDLCTSIDPACSQSCAQRCADLDALPPSCSDAVATAKSCIMNAGLTCNNGTAAPPNNDCANELSALSSCAPPMGAGGTGP